MVAVTRCRALRRKVPPIKKTDSSLPDLRAENRTKQSSNRLPTQHKRARKTRAEKRRPISVIVLLRLIYESNLPEATREQLASLLPSYATRRKKWRQRKRMSKKDRIWAREAIWTRLPEEENALIWKPLMFLADGFFRCRYTWVGHEVRAVQFLMGVLEQKAMRFNELEVAFSMLADIVHCGRFETADEDRIIDIWLWLMKTHRNPYGFSDGLMSSAVRCVMVAVFPIGLSMMYEVRSLRVAQILATHRTSMDYIFRTFASDPSLLRGTRFTWTCTEEGHLRWAIYLLISYLLNMLPAATRSSLVKEYRESFQIALSAIQPYDMDLVFRHEEILDIIATTPSALMNVWDNGARHNCEGSFERRSPAGSIRYWQRCPEWQTAKIILRSMEHALNDGPRLQSMIGEGFMNIAHHCASDEFDVTTTNADIFRQILAVHPELKRRFKENTKHGIATNEVAELGRSLGERPGKSGCMYIIEKEDSDEL